MSNPELRINNMVALIIMAADEREKRDGRGTSKGEAETMPVEYLSFADAIHLGRLSCTTLIAVKV